MAMVGIDLGTCNSVVATMEDHRVVIIDNKQGKQITPSVVFFTNSSLDDAIVGENAVNMAGNAPNRAVRYIKKQMGTNFEFQIDGEKYSPEQISSAILRKLIQDAEAFLQEKVTDVVITVPAWFGPPQREATKKAAEMVGVRVRATFPEPIAAAIDFAQAKPDLLAGKTILVYDLGGGTFDATLISVDKQLDGETLGFRVLGKDGSIELGGYNWDKALFDHAVKEFVKVHGQDPEKDPISEDLLMQTCRSAKESLSTMGRDDVYEIVCRHAGLEHKLALTLAQFEQLTQQLLDESIDKVSQLIISTFGKQFPNASTAELWSKVDLILLAGGSTKMPIVTERLKAISGKEPVTNRGVDMNVGRGAAYVMYSPHAWVDKTDLKESAATDGSAQPGGTPYRLPGEIEKDGPRIVIGGSVDTVSESIGINAFDLDTKRDINAIVIPKDSACDKEFEQVFGVHSNRQTNIDIVINAGESTDPNLVQPLGQVRISGLPSTTKAGEEVVVMLKVDGNGLIVGTAKHPISGKDAQIKIELKKKEAVAG